MFSAVTSTPGAKEESVDETSSNKRKIDEVSPPEAVVETLGEKSTQAKKPFSFFDRFYGGNPTASYVIGTKGPDNQMSFAQFENDENLDKNPYYRPINGVVPVADVLATPRHKRSKHYLEAYTPGGTKMESHRKIEINRQDDVTGEESLHTLFFLSPSKPEGVARTRMAHKQPVARSLDLDGINNLYPDQSVEVYKKGGHWMPVSPASQNRHILPDQNKVMGTTAKQSIASALEKHSSKFSLLQQERLEQIVTTEKTAEFLHCYAFSLCPKSINPQTVKNLGAGSSEANTAMYVLEKTAKELSRTPNVKSQVNTEFSMVLDTEVIKEIEQKVSAKYHDPKTGSARTFMFSRVLDPLIPIGLERNLLPSSADVTQTVSVAKQLINGKLPSVSVKIKSQD